MGILEKIIDSKQRELAELRGRKLPTPPRVRPIALGREPGAPLRLIAEFKRRSPSAGELSQVLDLEARVQAYERAGASMLSILCDGPFFGGSYEDLARAQAATQLPLLCKEFILEESQLDAARAYGASAALLIVRCLTAPRLAELIQAAEQRELVPLVEVIDEDESQTALDAGARFLGVNARDLNTLSMDGERARAVLGALPAGVVRCHFSGVRTTESVRALAKSGADAALVGEALMRQDDPTELLQSFVQAAR